jgi:ribosome-associated toxin RatA of RatAB toxin-antitoxin module
MDGLGADGTGILPTVTALEYSDSLFISVEPDQLYAMVSDVTRTGEWSPICRSCTWDEGDGPSVGAWFTGHNETPERTWEARCQVVAADPGREFTWEVNKGWARWGFTLELVDGGTRLTESWTFLPRGIAGFQKRFGDEADAQIAERSEAAHHGIPVTLAAIKKVAEAG